MSNPHKTAIADGISVLCALAAAIAISYLAIEAYCALVRELDWGPTAFGAGITTIITGLLAVALITAHALEK